LLFNPRPLSISLLPPSLSLIVPLLSPLSSSISTLKYILLPPYTLLIHTSKHSLLYSTLLSLSAPPRPPRLFPPFHPFPLLPPLSLISILFFLRFLPLSHLEGVHCSTRVPFCEFWHHCGMPALLHMHLSTLIFKGLFCTRRSSHAHDYPLSVKNQTQDGRLRPCLAQTTCRARPDQQYLHAQHRLNRATSHSTPAVKSSPFD